MIENPTDLTIRTYDKIATEYENRSFHLAPTVERVKFIRLIPKQRSPGKTRVLDAGCGYGREVRYFLDYDIDKTYGIDASNEMLSRARDRAPEANLKLMDVRGNLSFEDNFFDAVWCRGVLHHLKREEVPHAIDEFGRVLKPEGILLVVTQEGQGEAIICEDITSGEPRLITFFAQEELAKMVADAGFGLIESYQYNEKERYGEDSRDKNFVVVFARKTNLTSQ